MQGRVYSCSFNNVGIAVVQDFFYVKPAADKPVKLLYAEIGNVAGSAEAGDAEEELLRVEVLTLAATVTVGSGGSAVTPNPVLPNDVAASFTCRSNDTAVATTSGTLRVMHPGGMNNRVGYLYDPPDERCVVVANSAAFVVRLNLAPTDSTAMNGVIYVAELV